MDTGFSGGTLYIGIVAGVLGMGYLIYGRRQAKYSAVLAGLLLCLYPLFVTSVLWSCVIGIGLALAPFIIDF
jgi:hypothetical protein